MNAADPLAQLRDIHLPEPISWWPPAPGWWILALVISATVCMSTYLARKYWLKNRYRRAALRELKNFDITGRDNKQALLEELSILLRRVAVQTYGRKQVAHLSGDKWIAFLDKTGNTDQFTMGEAKILGSGLYQSSIEADMDKVRGIIQRWIKEHRK